MNLPRAGVIGVGRMGRRHAHALARLSHACKFVGVADVDPQRARMVAAEYGVEGFTDPHALLEGLDAVIIAAPTGVHLELGQAAVAAGVHFLLEKPACWTAAEAGQLENLAARAGLVAQVGHVERFNPAVRHLRELLAGRTPVAVEMRRLGPFDPRAAAMDVVHDLMIHDLDLLRHLFGGKPVCLTAAAQAWHTGRADHAVASLRLGEGVLATLTASRLTPWRARTLSVTVTDAFVEANLLEGTVRVSPPPGVRRNGTHGPRSNGSAAEPLLAQAEHFLAAVRGESVPAVGLGEAVAALQLVEAVRALIYREGLVARDGAGWQGTRPERVRARQGGSP